MIKQGEIMEYLVGLARTHPHKVVARLSKGSTVQKGSSAIYEIDNPDIDRQLGTFPEGTVPYGPIHRALKPSVNKTMSLFEGRPIVPFSAAFNAGTGECLEKAVLVQLSAQRGRNSFLINGALAQDGEMGVDWHAYNVIFRDGKPFLVDVQNPLAKDASGKITHPYIAPVLAIEDGDYGDFRVPEEWRQGRVYSLS